LEQMGTFADSRPAGLSKNLSFHQKGEQMKGANVVRGKVENIFFPPL
jgi:hypothetical protein